VRPDAAGSTVNDHVGLQKFDTTLGFATVSEVELWKPDSGLEGPQIRSYLTHRSDKIM
jgi:hypothetical protein